MKLDVSDEILFYSTSIINGKVTIKKNSREYIEVSFSDNKIIIDFHSWYGILSNEIISNLESLLKCFYLKFHLLSKLLSIKGRVVIKYNSKKIISI